MIHSPNLPDPGARRYLELRIRRGRLAKTCRALSMKRPRGPILGAYLIQPVVVANTYDATICALEALGLRVRVMLEVL